jgi:hypothetical protein
LDRARRELAVSEELNLILANMLGVETFRRATEVLREILHGVNVGADIVLGVVATLEFVRHQLPEAGHSNPLVTQTLHG